MTSCTGRPAGSHGAPWEPRENTTYCVVILVSRECPQGASKQRGVHGKMEIYIYICFGVWSRDGIVARVTKDPLSLEQVHGEVTGGRGGRREELEARHAKGSREQRKSGAAGGMGRIHATVLSTTLSTRGVKEMADHFIAII